MGIAVAPQDGRDRDEILQHADMALYQAKHGGRNRYSLFEWSMKERLHRVREIEAGLRRAIERGEFSMRYQPIRSEEHTSELQSLMRISYAVFCLKKKKQHNEYNY